MESDMKSREEVQEGNNTDIKAIGKNMSLGEGERNSASASPLFECPISLQVMSDPVTLCTGLTYDRTSIQKWRRLRPGNNICPLTGQTLHTRELIPNHTLAALIQKWRLPDPEVEENKKLLQHMIAQIDKDGASCKIGALRELRNLARDESHRSHLQSEGVVPALIRVIQGFNNDPAEEEAEAAVQEAIAAIVLFSVDDPICSRDLTSGPAIRTLEWVLAKGDLESRINAAALVEKLAKADDAAAAEMGSREGMTEALLTLLQQNNTLHSSLRALVRLCRVVSYRVKLAEAVGFISLLIRSLIGASERGVIEASMAVLEALSTVCQGRCGIMADSVAVTTIVANLVHVSRVATAHGVAILLNLCKNCNKEDEIRELVRSGLLQKLVALLHMDCEPRTKKRVNFLIKILSPLENYDSCAHFVIHL